MLGLYLKIIKGKRVMSTLLFSVSLRKESFNTYLIKLVQQILNTRQVPNNLINLNDFQMPYYNQDIQDNDGFPAAADALRQQISDASSIIISSPEYNFSMPGHFKNTIDWLSRYKPQPFRYKPTLLVSASPSMVGANRSLWALRVPLECLSACVFPDMFSLAQAHEAFTEQKTLKNQDLHNRLADTLQTFMKFADGVAL